MARTLLQIHAEIESLQREAATVRPTEVAGVISRIKDAIRFYGLTPDDLFDAPKPGTQRATAKRGPRKPVVKRPAGVVRYKDDGGNTWTGRGKRPKWFVDALAAGRTAQELEV